MDIKINQKITPFLWFNDNAEEAINLYVSIFKNSKIGTLNRYGKQAPPGMEGKVFSGSFEIEGLNFFVLNAGPKYKFTEAVSFFVNCASQEEVDDLWSKLIANGGEESRCGWLKDKFGLSWQIIPSALGKLMNDRDPVKANRVVQAMLQMNKISIVDLQNAYDGK